MNAYDVKQNKKPSASGTTDSVANSGAAQSHMDAFASPTGHGVMAEHANNQIDRLLGKDAQVLGGNNAKNGPDRSVNGVRVQTKYCKTAAESVRAAFEDGVYRYVNSDGTAMELEVPADQYDAAVDLMASRIRNGEVPGVTDPAKARSLVRRGHFTYAQARNMTRFGSIESLAFDAVQGAVVCTSAFGITAVLTFAQSIWNGSEPAIAVENALTAGVEVGGAAFLASVISSQLMRTGLRTALNIPAETIAKLLGPKASGLIASALKGGATVYGEAAVAQVSRLIRGNIVTSAVLVCVMSASDIANAFRGRISGKQLFKNMMSLAGGIAGGTGAMVAGNLILNLVAPGAGTVAGIIVSLAAGAAGGMAGDVGTRKLLGKFIEDDAVEMTRIVEEAFCRLAAEYVLSDIEAEITICDLARALRGTTLLEMYASPDREAFADELVRPVIERRIGFRCRSIHLPAEAVWLNGVDRLISAPPTDTLATQHMDPVEVARALGIPCDSEQAAKTGMYAAQQMNTALAQAELSVRSMAAADQQYTESTQLLHAERDAIKASIERLFAARRSGQHG